MQGIESSLQDLEEGQVQGMRRLAQGIMSAVEEAEASLQVPSLRDHNPHPCTLPLCTVISSCPSWKRLM